MGFVVASRPSEVAGRRYYEPSDHGAESEVAERLHTLWDREPDDGS